MSRRLLVRWRELSSLDIDRVVAHAAIPGYAGCLGLDQLDRVRNGQWAVVNLERSNQAGSHWCLAMNVWPDRVLRVDSFAFPPPRLAVRWMQAQGKPLLQYNGHERQSIDSMLCGEFCVHIANEMLVNKRTLQDVMCMDFWPPSRGVGTAMNDRVIAAVWEEVGWCRVVSPALIVPPLPRLQK